MLINDGNSNLRVHGILKPMELCYEDSHVLRHAGTELKDTLLLKEC